jgi:hypothetical protein
MSNIDVSNVAHAMVHVIPVNDAPVLSGRCVSFVPAPDHNLMGRPDGERRRQHHVCFGDGCHQRGTFAGDGDIIAANTGGTSISASYNAATGTLTLSDSDTLAHYQQVLDFVTFQSTSANPTNSNADPTRTVTWRPMTAAARTI